MLKEKIPKKSLIIFVLISIFILSGCFQFDAENLIKQNAQVKAFFDEYPNAEMSMIHLTKEQAQEIISEIREDCGNQMIAKEYYKAVIKDPDSQLHLTVYLDVENKRVECLLKKSLEKDKQGEKEEKGKDKKEKTKEEEEDDGDEDEDEDEEENKQPTDQQKEVWRAQCKLLCNLEQIDNFCNHIFKYETTEEFTCKTLGVDCAKAECPLKEPEETPSPEPQAEEVVNIQVICATDVLFDIKSVTKSESGDYTALIQNDGKTSIKSWKFRVYQDSGTVKAMDKDIPIQAFGIGQITITAADTQGLTAVRMVEAFPVIEIAGKNVICSQNLESFGDWNGNPF